MSNNECGWTVKASERVDGEGKKRKREKRADEVDEGPLCTQGIGYSMTQEQLAYLSTSNQQLRESLEWQLLLVSPRCPDDPSIHDKPRLPSSLPWPWLTASKSHLAWTE